MTDKYRGEGKIVDFVASGAVTAGQPFVSGHSLLVPIKSGVSGDTIPCYIEGIFELNKVDAAVFVVGEKLIWDITEDSDAGGFDDSAATPASGDLTGAAIAMRAGANGETTCLVKLTPGNVTKTA